ncbi:unnamed protein product [Rhizophagus irregularis]|uniref:Uncharacterized protein n=1 Tax=Rhizophagus irregularis TaxID=588596 RepID=A0A915ZVG4_9GLOM|nr:unnamed protein product [Rhizophagus irregularis]
MGKLQLSYRWSINKQQYFKLGAISEKNPVIGGMKCHAEVIASSKKYCQRNLKKEKILDYFHIYMIEIFFL